MSTAGSIWLAAIANDRGWRFVSPTVVTGPVGRPRSRAGSMTVVLGNKVLPSDNPQGADEIVMVSDRQVPFVKDASRWREPRSRGNSGWPDEPCPLTLRSYHEARFRDFTEPESLARRGGRAGRRTWRG